MTIPCLLLVLSVASSPSGTEQTDAAIEKVKQIVNQPVASFPRDPGARVVVYAPGWFHPGAITPDFARVDVRTTQQLAYERHEYVTSDLNPGVMFRGRDLEFNPMTKYFYTDRSLPKKRLTEEEMLEINRLYRVIARGAPVAGSGATPVSPASLGYFSAGLLVIAVGLRLYRRRPGSVK